jgi:hypothetical protein
MTNRNAKWRMSIFTRLLHAIEMRNYISKENVMKRNLLRIVIIYVVMISMSGWGFAQNLAAPYLQYSTSAMGASFGSAYTSLSEDASATYWNPAGLAGVKGFSFVGLASSGLALDRNFNAASLALDMKKLGVIAVSFAMSGVKNIQGYDVADTKTNVFDVVNMVPGISYAIRATPEFSFGTTVRYIRQDLKVQIDDGYSVDLGLRYLFNLSGTKIYTSGVVQNLFGKVGVNKLPKVMRIGLGASYGGIMKVGTLEGEVDYVVEDLSNSLNQKYVNVGVGYEVNLRGFILSFQSGFQNGENFAAGAGIGMSMKMMLIRVDYAYVAEPSQIFTNSHRIGVTISGK